ncbi:MAG: NAD(P)H-hydrate dehydratase [Gammaproteobacteria bacterium]
MTGMNNLPRHAYGATDVREFDRRAIEDYGVDGLELMQRAGQAAFDRLRANWPGVRRLIVLCGPGNNGGDGYVVATLALKAGMDVCVMAITPVEKLGGDAQHAYELFVADKGSVQALDFSRVAAADIIIDAMLGTGLQRPLEGQYDAAVRAVNESKRPVLALDIPTGLNADTGAVHGRCVIAKATVTFIALKAGLLTGAGPGVCGSLYYHDLRVPREIFRDTAPRVEILDAGTFHAVLGKRPRTAHKGDNGHLLVIGGNLGMPGSVRMAGEGALRVGAGLVSVATRNEHAAIVNATRPELMVRGVADAAALTELVSRASVIALGPGLGRDEWAEALYDAALHTSLPLVVDADGLNILAGRTDKRGNWVLTPHPGEAARLLGCDTKSVQEDRIAAVSAIADKFNAVVVLKGAGSLVSSADVAPIFCCTQGNPGMATAGMGDVLTGVIAGLLAQGLSLDDAAKLGVYLHALAGDAAAGKQERGLVATDLMPHLRKLVNSF